jgi:hypothetical protein
MSLQEENNIIEEVKILSFSESIPLINDKYISFLTELNEKFKYHDELSGPLESDLKLTHEKLPTNKYQVIDIITDNWLFCLEQLSDHNADYFIYQKEKTVKKQGKVFKNKLSKIGNRTLLKKILKDSESKYIEKIFKEIIEIVELLTEKDENNNLKFKNEYITYVKNNFNDNKNFSKMIMVIDNLDNLLNSKIGEEELIEKDNEIEKSIEDEKSNSKSKKNKKNSKSKNKNGLGQDFIKGLENTKIAQLAKNISQKINMDDFPVLSDPNKLLSSLGNPSEEGGLQNLLKFVVGEVEGAFKDNQMNEKDLVKEAQNIMGQFQNMSGFDPLSILKNDNVDINQFANIFAKMQK